MLDARRLWIFLVHSTFHFKLGNLILTFLNPCAFSSTLDVRNCLADAQETTREFARAGQFLIVRLYGEIPGISGGCAFFLVPWKKTTPAL